MERCEYALKYPILLQQLEDEEHAFTEQCHQ